MTCPHCTSGQPRSFGEHFRISNRGTERLGPCAAPDAEPGAPADTFRERLTAWVERMHAPRVAAILAPTNPDAPGHWTDEEDD